MPIGNGIAEACPLGAVTLVAIFSQFAKSEPRIFLCGLKIVVVHQALTVAFSVPASTTSVKVEIQASGSPVCVAASSGLHGSSGQGSGHGIGGYAVNVVHAVVIELHVGVALWILARNVQKVDSGEDGEEAAKERDGVHSVAGIEAPEEDKGRDKGESGKSHVVERVDTASSALVVT